MPGLIGFATLPIPPVSVERGSPNPKTASLGNDVLDRMRRAVTHRDTLVCDEPFDDGVVCAARVDTRLFQADPQPYSSGEVFVWIDGEIYNGRPSGTSDAALLATGYRDDPEFEFLLGIDGFFVAVVYDAAKRAVQLISDRYGFRQLFWTECAGNLW